MGCVCVHVCVLAHFHGSNLGHSLHMLDKHSTIELNSYPYDAFGVCLLFFIFWYLQKSHLVLEC